MIQLNGDKKNDKTEEAIWRIVVLLLYNIEISLKIKER
jgi:hypothetical protein